MNVKTRIPPSPTGRFHIRTARTALFNYLFARKNGGEFLFRIEDTDRERSQPEHEEDIVEGMKWLGLDFDGDIVRQSARQPRHQELLQRLVDEGKAYISKEPSTKDPSVEASVIRLENPGRSITFMDEVRGNITFDTTELGDFVIGRSIDDPLYHFAVVVDDADMGITHVIRGEDHISNTPRQILIQEALGLPRPIYAHLPLILAPDRSKLSKRHGAVSLLEYRQEGFLPGAILNYLALLGWNPGDDREDFSLAELIPLFDLSRVQKSGAVFDRVKFLDINQRYMRRLPDKEFIALGNFTQTDAEAIVKAVPLMKERAQTFAEARAMLDGELVFLFAAQTLDLATLTAKNVAGAPKGAKEHLASFVSMIEALTSNPTADEAKAALMPYADTIPKEEGGRGAALWPLRYALSGKERSPDPFTILSLLGRDESSARLASALAILE